MPARLYRSGRPRKLTGVPAASYLPGPPISSDLGWPAEAAGGRVEGISQAVVLSRDGLTLGASHGLSREEADHFSATISEVRPLRTEEPLTGMGIGVDDVTAVKHKRRHLNVPDQEE